MTTLAHQKTVGVCATCPWRLSNQGKRHPAGWYRIANLRRLWNGIRSGDAPGMVCHSTDPKSADYGSTKAVPETAKRGECGGALLIIFRHMEALQQMTPKEYGAAFPLPMKRGGIGHWLERYLVGNAFGNPIPSVTCDQPEDVGLPWEKR